MGKEYGVFSLPHFCGGVVASLRSLRPVPEVLCIQSIYAFVELYDITLIGIAVNFILSVPTAGIAPFVMGIVSTAISFLHKGAFLEFSS